MSNYSADLKWLRATYPRQYEKIPAHMTDNTDYAQMHGSFKDEGDTDWRWVIGFVSLIDNMIDNDTLVELDIPLPDLDTKFPTCAEHTLTVSRPFCSQHREEL